MRSQSSCESIVSGKIAGRAYIYAPARDIFKLKNMASETTKSNQRNFAVREENGEETSVFTGQTPRQAALKVARRLDPAENEAEATRESIRLRETGTKKLHLYEAWAWRDDAPENKPEWLPETITEANVSKLGIKHLDEL